MTEATPLGTSVYHSRRKLYRASRDSSTTRFNRLGIDGEVIGKLYTS